MENNNSWDFTNTVSDKANDIVNKYYRESYVDKFLNLEIVKTIFKNNLFLKLNSWFESNIKIITQIIWWLWIISWVFLILSPLQLVLLIFTFLNPTYLIYILFNAIFWLIIAIITFISWIGLIKMKKWVPFVTIIWFLVSSLFSILSNILSLSFPLYSYNMYYSRSIIWIIIWIAISIIISFTYTCLIVKNKDKFNN